ncbi:MAG: hypothetical protein PWP76_380 [Candidatus Diapherotrites archaeon]|nr:hypothetical protein [Candidatus Diapherotrites archaeon]MDN5366732.1 hypothetical protein [Candidatus Diapherotrites archaeon]
MGGRVPLVLGAVLAALLLIPAVHAQTCSVEQVSPKDYLRFLQAVYSQNGVLTLDSFGPAERPPVSPINRGSTAVIDEASGTYYPVDFNGSRAMDLRKGDFFPEGTTIIGPVFFVSVLDDTLRISKDSEIGYGNDKGLQQRFEGRMEYGTSREALEAVLNTAKTELEALVRLASMNATGGPRIKNVVLTRDFSVTATCASNGCDQEMYSLFTKYINVGASAQMIVEMGGGYVWRNFVPSSAKRKIYQKATVLKRKVTGPVSKVKDSILDDIAKTTDGAKVALKGGPEMGIGGILDPNFSPSRVDDLPVSDKQKIAMWAAYLDETGDSVVKNIDTLMLCAQKSEYCSKIDTKKLKESFGALQEALKKVGYTDADLVVRVPSEKGYKTVPLSTFLDTISKATPDQLHGLLGYYDLDDLATKLKYAKENAHRLTGHLADQVPVVTTISSKINEVVAENVKGGWTTAAAEYTVTPLAFYIVKRLAMAPHENPFVATGAYHVPFFSGLLGEGLPLPESWRITLVYPPEEGGYRDSFVDVLINNGSDPGDAFKSLISLSGGALIHKAISEMLGREIPTGGIILTEEHTKKYEMGPAIFSAGFSTQDCPACVLTFGDGRMTLHGPESTPFLGSVVEDANALSEGATAILFGHHTNFRMGDGTEIDIPEAEREGKSCYDTCPLVSNEFARKIFGDNPASAVFILSYLQSMSAVAGAPGVVVSGAATMLLMKDCGECVDTKGGYYLHIRVPPQEDSQQIFELTANDALTSILDTASSVLGGVSEELAAEINAFKQRALAESIRNSGAYVQFHADGVPHAEFFPAKLIELWTKPREIVQNAVSSDGSISGESSDGRKALFDKVNGSVTIDGTTVIANPDLVRLSYVDNRVPGIVVPAWVIVSAFTENPAFVATPDGYVVKDSSFLQCFASKIPGGEPTTEFFRSIMGDIIVINTDRGTVDFGDRVVAATQDWSAYVSRAEVGSDYNVTVTASTFEINAEGNTLNVDLDSSEKDIGRLQSIIFENGAIYYSDGKLLVHIRRLVHFPGNYVKSISMGPNDEKNGINVTFTPTANAPDDVREQIDRLNRLIKEMGGINSILSEDAAIALFRDENGVLWLRIFDRNAMASLTVEQAYEILRSVLEGDGKYDTFEVLDGSLRVYRDGGSVILSYVDRTTGQRRELMVQSYSEDVNGYLLRTEEGEHVVSVSEQDGIIVALLDGVVYGPVVVPGAVEQERVLDMYQDPNTGALVVKTDKGTHTIQVKVDQNGLPQLLVDGLLKGIVQAMQGPRGFVTYDPDTGEWSFVAGLLTPIAEAFKNGIRISLDASGNAVATPAPWSFRPNPYLSSRSQGLSLPLMEPGETVLLIMMLAAVFSIIR